MGANSSYLMPAAVVVAAMIIATGIYLGLRAQASVPAPAPVLPAPGPPPPPDRALVARQALSALAYQRGRLLDSCYRPAASAAAAPLSAGYTLDLTFDAAGTQILLGMNEHPGTGTPELTRCVTEQLVPLVIPPPGATVAVEIPLRFP